MKPNYRVNNRINNIRIILIRTFHPGNIGSIARSMKNMGLTNLYLVNPQKYPDKQADKMAAGACDILSTSITVATLDEAITDCSLVIGTSCRERSDVNYRPMLTPETTAKKIVDEANISQVALIFGQETMGMTNEELAKCNFHAYIDANPIYPVLNIAAATQIFCYEIYKYLTRNNSTTEKLPKTGYPTTQELQLFFNQLETALYDINFIIKQHPGNIIPRLKKLIAKIRPDNKDLNIIRGILNKIQKLPFNE